MVKIDSGFTNVAQLIRDENQKLLEKICSPMTGLTQQTKDDSAKLTEATNAMLFWGGKIKKGLEEPNASTGTPKSELHGPPRLNADLKSIGEGNMYRGIEATFNFAMAATTCNAFLQK